MKKTRLLVSLAVAMVAAFVTLRYRTIRQLETERTQLRQQAEEAKELRAAIAQKQTAPNTPPSAGLSFSERLELLRLRNEVGQLRREIAAESNQITMQAIKLGAKPVPATAYTPAEGAVTKAQTLVKLTRGKDWGPALIKYAIENGDEFPATLADAARFAPKAEGADEFELRVTGKMSAIKSPSCVIALREKQPWRAANGKWGRTYVFADGHAEIRHSDTEDFTELERIIAETIPAPAR